MLKILIAALLFPNLGIAALPTNLDERIRKVIQTEQEIPDTGVAVGIIKDGEIFLQGYGLRDRANKLPVTPETFFGIGSTTKAFVATSLLMTEEARLLNFNDPLTDTFPDFAIQNNTYATREFDTYDLLSHHSSLPRHDLAWYFNPALTYEKLPGHVRNCETNWKPGMGFREGFQYNNMMYGIAGRLLEIKTGMPWTHFIQERILRPMGMTETNFSVDISSTKENVALPYAKTLLLPFRNIDSMGPAGSINSNAKEMLLWTQTLLRRGVLPDGTPLLKPENFAKLTSRQTAIVKDQMRDIYYGLGWGVRHVNGITLVTHNGNIDGYSTTVGMVPGDHLGFVVLVNQNSTMLNNQVAVEIISALGMPREKEPDNPFAPLANLTGLVSMPEIALAKTSARNSWQYLREMLSATAPGGKEETPKLDLTKLLGTYEDPCYGELVVKRDPVGIKLNYYLLQGPMATAPEENMFFFEFHAGGEDQEKIPGKVIFRDGVAEEILLPMDSGITVNPKTEPEEYAKNPFRGWTRFIRKH